ncbi:hypothetical protein ACSAZK_08090 [Methanosarcina sp. Mfa9]|uniref:hypothetical protein n=1 Tax=Methanosarcina sp. Mfa9 TaxID=3439063 RepID=UPI003F83AB1D
MGKFVSTGRSLIERRYIKKIFTRNDRTCPFKLKMKNNMMGEIFEYYPGVPEKDVFINKIIFFK